MWKKYSFRNYIYYSLFHGAKMLSVQETCLGARIFFSIKTNIEKGQLLMFSEIPVILFFYQTISLTGKKKKKCWLLHQSKAFKESKIKECNANVLSHFSRVQLFATSVDCTRQAPLSMGFSRQEYWSWLPFPSPRDLPERGSVSPAIAS